MGGQVVADRASAQNGPGAVKTEGFGLAAIAIGPRGLRSLLCVCGQGLGIPVEQFVGLRV